MLLFRVRMPKRCVLLVIWKIYTYMELMDVFSVVRCQQMIDRPKNQVSNTTSAPLVVVTARLHAARQGHTDTVD